MVEIASFIIADETFVARGIVQLWELDCVRLDSILQPRRSSVIADEDAIPVCWVVENAGSSHCIHDHSYVFVASCNEYVDVWNIVSNQVPFFSDCRLDGKDSQKIWNGIWHCSKE